MTPTVARGFTRLSADGQSSEIVRELAMETPVAIEVNGVGYAVLMATPSNLVDLAYGFLLTERLIEAAGEMIDVDVIETAAGIILRATVVAASAERVVQRVRHRTSDSSCGLCGIENLEQLHRALPTIRRRWTGDDTAIFVALGGLRQRQALNEVTGAVHAAARCDAAGRILDVREDVGRHNAFDKLIGTIIRAGGSWEESFALLTSRCSYEMVEKAAIAGCPMLATISAPTDLAVRRAGEAELALRVLARPDALLATP